MNRYDILESISHGKDDEVPEENKLLVQIANDIRRSTEGCDDDEKKSGYGRENVMSVNESEKRYIIWQHLDFKIFLKVLSQMESIY